MGNCANNCSNYCTGKGGDPDEFNMSRQEVDLRYGNSNEVAKLGTRKFGEDTRRFAEDKDLNKHLQKNVKYIVKLQAFWKGHTARRLIGLLKAKQLGSSKYFTQDEARETIS